MRYVIANLLYRLRFPSGWIQATDFRPHFEGYLLNVYTLIRPGLDEAAVEAALSSRLQASFRWMRLLRFLMRRNDKVQYCLGTRNPLQQYINAWSSREDLSAGIPPRDVQRYRMTALES